MPESPSEEPLPPGHTLDEFGDHEPDECYECLLGQEVKGDCRCGKCCTLLVEVGLEDAEREPKIRERGSPIYTSAILTGAVQRELAGYLLNTEDNSYACTFLDKPSGLCTIYDTRPLACRLFDCAGEGREQLIELGIIERG
jgi:Fe-S-cluster containining protein